MADHEFPKPIPLSPKAVGLKNDRHYRIEERIKEAANNHTKIVLDTASTISG